MAKLTGRKIRSSSLVEIVVAMVIITAVFSIALMTQLNLMRSGFSLSRLKAAGILEQEAARTKLNKAWIDEESEGGGFKILKTVEPYTGQSGLMLLSLEAYTPEGELQASYREIIEPGANE